MANPTGINQYTKGGGAALEHHRERAEANSKMAAMGTQRAVESKNPLDHLEAARRHDVAAASHRGLARQFPEGSARHEAHNDVAREHEAQSRYHAETEHRLNPTAAGAANLARNAAAHPAAGTAHAAHYDQAKAQASQKDQAVFHREDTSRDARAGAASAAARANPTAETHHAAYVAHSIAADVAHGDVAYQHHRDEADRHYKAYKALRAKK